MNLEAFAAGGTSSGCQMVIAALDYFVSCAAMLAHSQSSCNPCTGRTTFSWVLHQSCCPFPEMCAPAASLDPVDHCPAAAPRLTLALQPCRELRVLNSAQSIHTGTADVQVWPALLAMLRFTGS